MFCYNCGKTIPDCVKFCRYCGASQAIVNSGSTGGAQAQPNHQSYNYVLQQPVVSQQPLFQQPVAPQQQPLPQQPVAPQQQPLPQQPVAPQQFQQPLAFPQPPQTATAMLASQKCSYKVAMESDFKKFEFGGMPEGTVEIYDDRLEFFQKSKMVALAFLL